jgi:hypothetical protein
MLCRTDPLLGKDLETDNEITAVATKCFVRGWTAFVKTAMNLICSMREDGLLE